MRSIGFIGIGVMGKHMVRNLMKNGYEVSIYSRTKSKAKEVIEEGALWCDDIKSCVNNKDVVITIVGYPKDVEEVYFGENGIIENSNKGTILIDMTTTSPKLSERIYEEGMKKGLLALDAPVSGGDIGAKNGTLSIMVGGDEEVFAKALDVFKAMGTNIIYEGKAGAGQHTKMANQIAIAGTIAGTCEAIAYGRANGLDTRKMLNSISEGAAGSWQLKNNGKNILDENLDPGFYIKHFIKDMKIANDEAEGRKLSLDILKDVLKIYEELENEGMGDLGTQALIKYYSKK
ncbi:2-hydroxy-3-oxopropionate reductase [Clostridium bornimense]|uniref:2-hydroxy-3-oxopropionate reductase n=1 Tax=Clostridium bornimense TaxID=1216932 RepID=W6RTR3_9CLOT|nr:NAD(P)-dependent oxidoreductase [Clostridium bornimense]CDM67991.1 2-hydroxy-3-oxopropionate reductase [Clostridium bornimense]